MGSNRKGVKCGDAKLFKNGAYYVSPGEVHGLMQGASLANNTLKVPDIQQCENVADHLTAVHLSSDDVGYRKLLNRMGMDAVNFEIPISSGIDLTKLTVEDYLAKYVKYDSLRARILRKVYNQLNPRVGEADAGLTFDQLHDGIIAYVGPNCFNNDQLPIELKFNPMFSNLVNCRSTNGGEKHRRICGTELDELEEKIDDWISERRPITLNLSNARRTTLSVLKLERFLNDLGFYRDGGEAVNFDTFAGLSLLVEKIVSSETEDGIMGFGGKREDLSSHTYPVNESLSKFLTTAMMTYVGLAAFYFHFLQHN